MSAPNEAPVWHVAKLVFVALLGLSQVADAQQQRLLHEFLPPDLKEDLELNSTTHSGDLPAAVETPSGTIRPPDLHQTPEPSRTYHGDEQTNPSFRPDRDTRRPSVEHYDDPFTPSLTPFKRLYAFDGVREDYTLYVKDPDLRPLPTSATAGDGDERFFGDMSLQLRGSQPVRIPSIGPGAQILKLVTAPRTEVTVWHDSAENWFVKSEHARRIRLISELSIPRDTFGSNFAEVSWRGLKSVPPQPRIHRTASRRVLKAIGISKRRQSPREVVAKMVAYFRSFEPSTESPTEHSDIYLDLALSKKGVCRHRAFAFMVTALNLGIPTRLIHNEAHAWVEVHDGKLWHRVDLGGAALNLEHQPRLDRPPHVPPPDPYEWPAGRDSGADLAHRHRQEAIRDMVESSPEGGEGGQQASEPDPAEPPDPAASSSSQPPDPSLPERSAAEMTIDRIDKDIFRGLPLHIKGKVAADGAPCAHVRVDLMLVDQLAGERRLGSLSTDERGIYDGAVILPRDLPIGDHNLVVRTGGNAVCGPGEVR